MNDFLFFSGIQPFWIWNSFNAQPNIESEKKICWIFSCHDSIEFFNLQKSFQQKFSESSFHSFIKAYMHYVQETVNDLNLELKRKDWGYFCLSLSRILLFDFRYVWQFSLCLTFQTALNMMYGFPSVWIQVKEKEKQEHLRTIKSISKPSKKGEFHTINNVLIHIDSVIAWVFPKNHNLKHNTFGIIVTPLTNYLRMYCRVKEFL